MKPIKSQQERCLKKQIEKEDLMDKEVQLDVNVFRLIFERHELLKRVIFLEQQILEVQQELDSAKAKRKLHTSYINKYCRPKMGRLGEKKE